MTPNRAEDEKELNKDTTKGQNTAHNDTGQRFGVENLVRNCAGDCIGANFVKNLVFIISNQLKREKYFYLSLKSDPYHSKTQSWD